MCCVFFSLRMSFDSAAAALIQLRLDTAVLCMDTAASSSDITPRHDRPALLWDLTNNITYGCWKSDGTDTNDGYVESTPALGFGQSVSVYAFKFFFPTYH